MASSSSVDPSLRFANEAEPNFEYNYLIKIIAVIQFVAEILTIFHVCYILNIFIKVKTCHIHFRVLSSIFLFDLILKASTNLIVLVKFITGKTFLQTANQYYIANLIQVTANYIYYFFPLSIFVERTVPLVWAKRYEKYFSITFIIVFTVAPLMGAFYQTIHLFFLQAWLNILVIYCTTNITMISGWLVYFIVYYLTRKYYNKNRKNNNNNNNNQRVQTVSERYQRFENLRTHRTMTWFAASSLISLFMAAAYIHFMMNYTIWFPNISVVNMTALVRILLDVGQAFLFLIVPMSFTFTHERLWKKYIHPFKCLQKKAIRITSSHDIPMVKSITGHNLVIRNEQEYYFNSLISEWENKLPRKK